MWVGPLASTNAPKGNGMTENSHGDQARMAMANGTECQGH